MSIMGATEGVIMPIIMATHIPKTQANSIGLPWCARRHHPTLPSRNHAEAGHIHAVHPHVVGEPNEVRPGKYGDDGKRGDDDSAVASQHRLERGTHRRSTHDATLAEVDVANCA